MDNLFNANRILRVPIWQISLISKEKKKKKFKFWLLKRTGKNRLNLTEDKYLG